MAQPSLIWKVQMSGNSANKEIANKSVIQEITITNTTGSQIVVDVFRTPYAERLTPVNPLQDSCRIRKGIAVGANGTQTLSNLRWVMGEGDYLAFSAGASGLLIYVDGVEFD